LNISNPLDFFTEIESRNFVIRVKFIKKFVVSLGSGKFLNKLFIDISISSIFIELVQKIVNLDFSGIDSRSGVDVISIQGSLEILSDFSQKFISFIFSHSLECSDRLAGKRKVSPLHDLKKKKKKNDKN
jgi:hypothetical protein